MGRTRLNPQSARSRFSSPSLNRSDRLVLASRSPQRKAILEQLGIPFDVQVPEVDELSAGDPEMVVLENARRKALAIGGDRVLGVDTEVLIDGELLGKAATPEEART